MSPKPLLPIPTMFGAVLPIPELVPDVARTVDARAADCVDECWPQLEAATHVEDEGRIETARATSRSSSAL
jgi:hypothetical protein